MSSYLEKNTIYSNSSANNHNAQILVKGWKQITTFSGFASTIYTAKLEANGERARLTLSAEGISVTAWTAKTLFTIPSGYRPINNVISDHMTNAMTSHLYVKSDGTTQILDTTTENLATYFVMEWSY